MSLGNRAAIIRTCHPELGCAGGRGEGPPAVVHSCLEERSATSNLSRHEFTMYYSRSSLAPPTRTTKLGMTSSFISRWMPSP